MAGGIKKFIFLSAGVVFLISDRENETQMLSGATVHEHNSSCLGSLAAQTSAAQITEDSDSLKKKLESQAAAVAGRRRLLGDSHYVVPEEHKVKAEVLEEQNAGSVLAFVAEASEKTRDPLVFTYFKEQIELPDRNDWHPLVDAAGAFGDIHWAVATLKGGTSPATITVAIKEAKADPNHLPDFSADSTDKGVAGLRDEIDAMKAVQEVWPSNKGEMPAIAMLYGTKGSEATGPLLVLPFATDGDLDSKKAKLRLTRGCAWRLLRQSTDFFLNEPKLVHRDIKPENYFLFPSYLPKQQVEQVSFKIADFGMASIEFEKSGAQKVAGWVSEDGTPNCGGSPEYSRPPTEYSRQGGNCEIQDDIFGLGMTVLELIGVPEKRKSVVIKICEKKKKRMGMRCDPRAKVIMEMPHNVEWFMGQNEAWKSNGADMEDDEERDAMVGLLQHMLHTPASAEEARLHASWEKMDKYLNSVSQYDFGCPYDLLK